MPRIRGIDATLRRPLRDCPLPPFPPRHFDSLTDLPVNATLALIAIPQWAVTWIYVEKRVTHRFPIIICGCVLPSILRFYLSALYAQI